MKGVQGADDLAGLPTKAVETLDMLQKSQLKVGGNFGAEQKTLKAITSTVNNFTLTLMAASLFLGSCLLCLTNMQLQIAGVPALGFCGFLAGICLMVKVLLQIKPPSHDGQSLVKFVLGQTKARGQRPNPHSWHIRSQTVTQAVWLFRLLTGLQRPCGRACGFTGRDTAQALQ